MDKRRQPQTIFRWRVDTAGYDLSSDRRMIVRRGGAMKEYDPAGVTPPLHRQFADLFFWGFHAEGGANPPPAGFQRENAMLDFVSKFGFLGSDRTGADADQETIEYLLRAQSEIAGFLHVGEAFGEAVLPYVEGRHAGPNLRMCLEPDDGGRMQVHYEPESLYAWLWLRVADHLSSGIKWDGAPCLYCLAPIGRGPGGHRADAKFCCDNHRVNFSRLSTPEQKKQKAKAREITRSTGG